MKTMAVAVALLVAATAHAEPAQQITCKGSITSIQGEGLVARTHHFEVETVSGPDLMTVLEKCKSIAEEKQNRAARKNPGGNFRNVSDLQLECVRGSEKFPVRRALRTRK